MSDTVGQIALELGIDSSQIVNQLTGASNKAAKQATSIFSGLGKKIAAGLSIAAERLHRSRFECHRSAECC